MPGINPFHYCYNNPMRYIDPTGLQGEAFGQQDMWGRDRFDSFTGTYIPPMDRPGGMSARGYGDPQYGHFESTNELLYDVWTYRKDANGNEYWYNTPYDVYKRKWVWEPTEQRLYGNASRRQGGNYILNYAIKFTTGFSIVNKVREVLEWEYLRQARYNRALSGNFSQPIKHSLRSIIKVGQGASLLGGALSVGEFYGSL